ncbi:MAG: hypothetical protein ACR65O_06405 [Methylomicrobium sp.]
MKELLAVLRLVNSSVWPHNVKSRLITTAVVVALGISGCLKDEWEGFIYPNKDNLSEHITIGSYKSLEECRTSAISALNKISSVSSGDYECELGCELRSDMGGIKVCEKTER